MHDKKPRANPHLLVQLQERLRQELAGVISIIAKLREMNRIGMEVRWEWSGRDVCRLDATVG